MGCVTQFSSAALTIIEADALKFDWRTFSEGEKLRVVGNLPYNISSPLLFKLAEISDRVVGSAFHASKRSRRSNDSRTGEQNLRQALRDASAQVPHGQTL